MSHVYGEKALIAFNIWSIASAEAIIDAARQANQDVILQTSASVFQKLNQKQLKEFVISYTEQCGIKVWLHLDHCKNPKMIKEAIDCGWNSVMIDGSSLPVEQNIALTNQVTEMAHKSNVLVEAEVGRINGTEEDITVINRNTASREEIRLFVQNTAVDMLAVAFGNAHGIYQGTPQLDYELVEYTTGLSNIPFVVHGGSGLSDDVLKRLLSIKGVKKINISTEVKMAYRNGILNAESSGLLSEQGFQAIKVEKEIHDSIVKMAMGKFHLLE